MAEKGRTITVPLRDGKSAGHANVYPEIHTVTLLTSDGKEWDGKFSKETDMSEQALSEEEEDTKPTVPQCEVMTDGNRCPRAAIIIHKTDIVMMCKECRDKLEKVVEENG